MCIFDTPKAGLQMADIAGLLKEIEDIKIEGTAPDNLNDSLRALVTHDQRLSHIIDKGKVSGMHVC